MLVEDILPVYRSRGRRKTVWEARSTTQWRKASTRMGAGGEYPSNRGGHLMSTCDIYHEGVMEHISGDDNTFNRLPPCFLSKYRTLKMERRLSMGTCGLRYAVIDQRDGSKNEKSHWGAALQVHVAKVLIWQGIGHWPWKTPTPTDAFQHSVDKHPGFQWCIWSALPVQKTCATSVCLSRGIRSKGPVSTSLSWDRPLFMQPLNTSVVASHAVCHLAREVFEKELAKAVGSVAQAHGLRWCLSV